MATKNLNQSTLRQDRKRLDALETASPLAHSSVGRGRVRFYDNSELLVENGALQVTGTATITGTLQADGTINLTGTVQITGPLTITGATDITGPLSVEGQTDITGPLGIKGNTEVSGNLNVTGPMATKGTLSVEGVTTLKNDLNVVSGGEVKVGTNMRFTPSVGGGSAVFPNGSMEGTPNGVQLTNTARSRYVYASADQAGITSGANAFVVNANGSHVLGVPTTTLAANVYMDANGKLFRRA